MTVEKNFKGLIWTNHALQRLQERGLSQGDAWLTWRHPDQSRYAKNKGAWIYDKTFGEQRIEVAAKKNEKGKWLVLSVWSRMVVEKRIIKKKRKSFWRLLWGKIFG